MFKEKIYEIFGYKPASYREDLSRNTLDFTLDGQSYISYDKLHLLSQLLGTIDINFTGRREEYRYSEWTADVSYYGDFTCYNVKFKQ